MKYSSTQIIAQYAILIRTSIRFEFGDFSNKTVSLVLDFGLMNTA